MAVTLACVVKAIVALLVVSAFFVACFTLPIEKILKNFLVWIDTNLGHWGPLVLTLSYIPLTVLGVPAFILTLGGGYLFGLPIGFIADSVGSILGAIAAFLIGKMVGRQHVMSVLKDYPKLQAIDTAIRRSGFKIVFLLRLAPLVPFNIVNYLLSVTPISIQDYILASWMGMVPITLFFVYIGTTINDLSRVTHTWRDIISTHGIILPASVIATILLMVLATRIAKKAINEAVEEDNANAESYYISVDSALVDEPYLDFQQAVVVKEYPTVDESYVDLQQALLNKEILL
ncbi:hypothetical protein SUGI_0045240 [Cryptomeria japonica]|uniref:uncharacterized protein LOC131043577 isoform X1 n=1 Tax=Cryptomeria japonica TaxID=3369 RepID=UPI002408E0A9|nr:uncharacterized protein LOC131043577 isoform X1 [Cryptomeria japonica]GLJ06688.1 hypothetical protein SUGI_0045240 [Cryptomeria japonica]